MNSPDLRRMALSTLVPGFYGTTAPEWAKELLAEGLAGYCLFGYNVESRTQLARLSTSLRDANHRAIIAIDEEGGDVTRLHTASGSPYPGNAALGAIDDLALTEAIHYAIGRDLTGVGVNVNFAPAVDVNVEDDNPVIGTRSFGRDPQLVARHAAAAVAGYHRAGIIACAKHFPGHGATTVDSHLALPTVDVDLDTLRQRELVPFRTVIKSGIHMIMSGHIRVPALTGDKPATLSSSAMHDLLRVELGYDGVIMTDAMEMKGASATIGLSNAIVEALIAGCDMICTGGELQKQGPMTDVINAIVTAITTAVTDGRLPLSRLEEAQRRVNALTLTPPHAHTISPDVPLGLDAARRAIVVEGTVPKRDDPLILQLNTTANIAVGDSTWGITRSLADILPLATVEHVRLDAVDLTKLTALTAGRTTIVVSRDTHRRSTAIELVERLAAVNDVVLVEMGWPASWRPRGITAYIATHGAAAANAQAAVEHIVP